MKASTTTSILIYLLTCASSSRAQFLGEESRGYAGISFCGCRDCNRAAYNQPANGASCGDQILHQIFDQGMTEEDACKLVAGEKFRSQCGPACDPSRCDGRGGDPGPIGVAGMLTGPVAAAARPLPPPANCNCASCTQEVWDRKVGWPAYSCGARIEYMMKVNGLSQEGACYDVSALQFSSDTTECGLCNPKTCGIQAAPEMRPAIENKPVTPARDTNVPAVSAEALSVSDNVQVAPKCGCSRCTENILNNMADGHTCLERIEYLEKSMSEEEACREVAQIEFPSQCGPHCDPDRCHGLAHSLEFPNGRGASYDMDLYCFPPIASRKIYDNVWGKYTLQVKSDPKPCGPSGNMYSTETVSVVNHGRDLKLQYKKIGDQWHGSEVRVLLPQEQMPYQYGSYTFSIKSINVIDSQTGSLINTILPPSLVLGLFTWDPLEDYASHENWNHEVDVEISRWNVPGQADAQFLVQPPGDPQTHRFFTGSVDKAYQQAPRIYGFDWRPTEVEWYSNAGSRGQRFTYSTQDALHAGTMDYNQCMPANVEVRMNLWNLYGSEVNPPEMADTHVVEVVIDTFQFVPSGRQFVNDGHVCSKDCHCGPSSKCFQNRCTPAGGIARGGTRSRRMQTSSGGGHHEEGAMDPVASSAPVILFLMGLNLMLALVVIQRPFFKEEEVEVTPAEVTFDESCYSQPSKAEKPVAIETAVECQS